MIELVFEHFAGLDEATCLARLSDPETAATVQRGCGRAEECLLPPSSSAVTAGLASAAVVGGTMAAGLGASVANTGCALNANQKKNHLNVIIRVVRETGASAGIGGGGMMGMVGAVQFIAVSSNLCVLQGSQKFADFLAMYAFLQTAHRSDMPCRNKIE